MKLELSPELWAVQKPVVDGLSPFVRFHTAAAMLAGQPFGFWPELPRTLRIAAEKLRVLTDAPDDWFDLDDAADRIEALLLPEDE